MKPEVLFLKYAFPCTIVKMQRGELTQEEFDKLENAAADNKILPREFLEKTYSNAFRRMGKVSEELKKDIWSIEVIKDYFLNKHNEMIDNNEEIYSRAPETLKELCKVYKSKVIDIRGDYMIVKYNDKTRSVMKTLVPNVKIGDTVTIHYGYAVEIV